VRSVGVSWKQVRPTGRFDAIVIGSGIGGLVAAAGLARLANRRVLVLERHARIGGYTHTFTRPGYEWDVGVHSVGAVGERGALRSLFDTLTDGRLRWAPLPDVYDRVEIGGVGYDFVAGRERFSRTLLQSFPGAQAVLREYVKLVVSTARRWQASLLRQEPVSRPRLEGQVFSPSTGDPLQRTTLEVLRSLTSDERLIAVLTGQYGDYGLPPSRSAFAFHAGVVEHYLDGGFYPVGGGSQLAATLAPAIEDAGGHLATLAEVDSLLVEDGAVVGVRLVGGEAVRAPVVISDAGLRNTLHRLVPEAHRPSEWLEHLAHVGPSTPHLCLYLGFRDTDEALGLTGTNLWCYPDGHHDEHVERFARDPDAPFPMLFFSFSSAKDPDFARRHPGRATMEVVTMARWEWFAPWAQTRWRRRGEDYEALKRRFTERLLEAVYARLPQVRGRVDHAELSTPLSTAHFSGHPTGEMYGLDASPARLRLGATAKTPLPGLYLTGADIAASGVGGAAFGGLLTVGALLGTSAITTLMRPAAGAAW
jgi:all-trans-retinol 13,14-reductase